MVFGVFTCALTLLNLLNFVVAFASSARSSKEIVLLNSRGAAVAFVVMPFIAFFLYLLFSAMAHFSAGKAAGLWVGEILLTLLWFGVFLLLFEASYGIIALLGLIGVVPPVILVVRAVVKKDIRFGWGAAALLFGFWSGIATLLVYADMWETVLYFYGCFPFIAFCAFIIGDLYCTSKSIRRDRIAAAQ